MLSDKPAAATARWVWLMLSLAVIAIYPALTQNVGAYAYDAGTVHIYRGVVYSDAVSDGALYPRWVQFLHLGLGSPSFTFLPPLAYAGMDLLSRFGLPHPVGWRIMMALGLLAAAIGAYLLVRELTARKWPALLAGVAFLYAPYVLRNAFERGSVEAFGTFLYPWVLWGLIHLARRPSGGRLLLASVFWAACIALHVLAPLMLAPFAIVVAILTGWRHRTASPLLALLAGGLLAAFVWAPMLAEQQFVQVEQDFQAAKADVVQNSLPLDRLAALPAVYDIVRDDNTTGDRLGLWHLLWLVIGVPATFYAWRRGHRDLALILGIATIAGLLLFWMLTAASDPLWRLLEPLLGRLQYRSRLMGVQALAIAVLAGAGLALLPGRWQSRLGFLLTGILILSALPSLYVNLQHHYATFEDTISLEQVRTAEIASGGSAFTSFGEFMPRWRTAPFDQALIDELGPMFDAATRPLADPPAGVSVNSARVRSNAWDLTVEAAGPTTLTLHLLFYPRWEAFLDEQPLALRPQPATGYTQLDVPAGTHQISLRYGSTLAERAGIAVSVLALLALVAAAILRRPGETYLASKVTTTDLPISRQTEVIPPAWWLLLGLTAALALKLIYVDTSTTWFRCVSTPARVCGAQKTVDIPFVGGPRLRGYSVSKTAFKPGDLMRVSLYWQGEPGDRKRRTSFVHIRNSQKGWPMNPHTENELWAQDEHEAPGGILSTEYLPGRLYLDEFRVRLPGDMPPGTYFLEIGWADSTTGEQLDPQPDAVKPPLSVLWRSILLPSIEVR